MKIAFVGLAWNCPSFYPNLLAQVARELDSRPLEWKAWISTQPDHSSTHMNTTRWGRATVLHDPPVVPADSRYTKLARLRNTLLDAVRKSDWEPDIVWALDLDIHALGSMAGFGKLQYGGWDAVSMLGLYRWKPLQHYHPGPVFRVKGDDYVYYDLLAFKNTAGHRHLWRHHIKPADGWYAHSATGDCGEGLFTSQTAIVRSDRWTPVFSAFGPGTFYRWESIKDLRYSETTHQCEHQAFHDAMRRAGGSHFVAHDISAFYIP